VSRDRMFILAQCAAAIFLVVATSVPGIADGWRVDGSLAITFAACVAVLTAFSVWLPRGDSVDSTAPMAFAAGAFVTPALMALMIAVGWAAGIVAQRRSLDLWRFLEHASRRALLMCVTFRLLAPVIARTASGGATGVALDTVGYATLGACGVLFITVDLLIEQMHTSVRLSIPYVALVISNVQLRSWMIAAEVSVSVLTVLIYRPMGLYGLVISSAMLLVMRQSFALLLEMRASYTATVEVLARSLEAYDPQRRGHAERVARMAGDAARRVGFQSKRLEDVVYAALFHDVGRLGADDADGEGERTSSEVLADVNLLSGALPILRILDSPSEAEASPVEHDLVGAYLIARLSELDSAANLGSDLGAGLGDAIGARLYAGTRRTADRVLRQIESTASGTPGPSAELPDVVE